MPTQQATDLLDSLLGALLARDKTTLERIADQLEEDDVAPVIVYSVLFAPALQRIGELWATGEISVAEEHIASSLVEALMARTYLRAFVAARSSRERIVMACVEGDHHTLGLRMSADHLEGAGFGVVLLGTDTPTLALLEAVERYKPAALVLAAETDDSIDALGEAIKALEESNLGPVPVLVGGASATIRDRLGSGHHVRVIDDIATATAEVERAIASHRRDPTFF